MTGAENSKSQAGDASKHSANMMISKIWAAGVMCGAKLNHALVKHLAETPAPGGNGCHQSLLRNANYCRISGLTREQATAVIRVAIPYGSRVVDDREISDAVEKAFASPSKGGGAVRPSTSLKQEFDGQVAFNGIVRKGMALIVEKGGVENISPVMIPVDGTAQLKEIFKLYGLAEKLFIGPKFHEPLGASDREREKLEQQAECIKPVEEWLRMLDEGVFPFAESPHICRNPFSGEIGQTLKNMQSMRSDSCVCTFKFAVGELDSLPKTWKGGGQSIPMDEQAAFWLGMDALGIPVSALISSGGKSVHAWLRMDCPDRAAWDCDVEQGLFACILKPLGLDSSCQNESRLSRTPGHLRAESGRPQTLIYLNLEAGK